jgi:hypothetical protein
MIRELLSPRIRSQSRVYILLVLAAVLTGCGASSDGITNSTGSIPQNLWKPDPSLLPLSGNYLLLASDQGDPIGKGVIKVYRAPESVIDVVANGNRITLWDRAFPSSFHADFSGLPGANLISIGYYGGVQRFPFNDPNKGGLDVAVAGIGCNTLSGWFYIDNIGYAGTTLTAIDLRFEQHCNEGSPALHGALHWRA